MGSTKTTEQKMPEFQQKFLEQTVIPFAEDFLATPYETYTGQRVAGMTPLQRQALAGYSDINMGGEDYGQAIDIYGQLSKFESPEAQAARLGEVGQLATTDIGTYMSPYTQAVIEAGQADIERQRQLASENLASQAQKAGAFGGSRQAVQEGILAGEAARQAGQLSAQQRAQAFQQAQQAAQFDITGQQQRAIQQAQFEQAANLANQQAALAAAGIQSGAAAGIGATAGQRLQSELAGLGAQMQAGEAERQIQQAQLDAAYQDFMQQQQYPLTQFGVLTGTAGAVPSGYGTTTTRTGGLGPAMSAFGAGAKGVMTLAPLFSDARLKDDVTKVGEVNGVNLYSWKWNGEAKRLGAEGQPEIGVMAQEIEKTHPQHVHIGADGYRRVDYVGLFNELEVA